MKKMEEDYGFLFFKSSWNDLEWIDEEILVSIKDMACAYSNTHELSLFPLFDSSKYVGDKVDGLYIRTVLSM